jgi:protein involved in ribonucleotide reduction
MIVVYYSNRSENTHRFVQKLGVESVRLPLRVSEEPPEVTDEYVLIVPTYGAGRGTSAVPLPVIKFLNVETNRTLLRGVIGAGNTNFGSSYCLAADIVSHKCNVPVLHRFEIMGMPEDVTEVQTKITQLEEDNQ